MPSTVRTVIQDDNNHLFLCLESDALPPVPARGITFQDPKNSWLPDPEDFIRRSWASDTMPYQGFLPFYRSSVYQCDLFKCLDYSSASIPLFSPSPGQWALETKVADEWKHLEYLLVLPRFPLPWEYGFHHAKCHKMAMEDAAIRSRNAFLILAGEISFLLALTIAKNEGEDWEIMLTEEVGGNWTDLIRSSWIVQKDSGFWQGEEASRRVGLFVDPRICKTAANFLEAYMAYGIPVWIDWGPITSPFEPLDSVLYQRYYFWPCRVIHHTTAEYPAPQMRDVLPRPTVMQQVGEIFVDSESEDSEQNVLQQTPKYSNILSASHTDEKRATIEGPKHLEEMEIRHTPTCEEEGFSAQNPELDLDEQQYSIGTVDVSVWEKVNNKDPIGARRRASDFDMPPLQEYPPLCNGSLAVQRPGEKHTQNFLMCNLRCSGKVLNPKSMSIGPWRMSCTFGLAYR